MITTEQVFRLVEPYLFAFSSTEDAIKEIFNNDIKLYTKMPKENIEKEVSEKIKGYLKKQFDSEQFPILIDKYAKPKKKLLKKDIAFIDTILIGTEYIPTYEDIDAVLKINKIKDYLKKHKDDESHTIEIIKEFQEELDEIEEDLEEEPTVDKEYDGGDCEKLYRRDAARYELLTPQEERELLIRYKQQGDEEAFEILVGANQGLCQKVARKYKNRGIPELDLIQEGNIGLIKALNRFDITRTTKLSTYAMWWIRQAVKTIVNEESKSIHLPYNFSEEQSKLTRVEEEFINKNGREPSIEELTKITGFKKSKIETLRKYELNFVSFEKPVNEEESDASELGDFLTSDYIKNPEELADIQSDKETLILLFRLMHESKLSQSEIIEDIIRLRVGYELYNEKVLRIIKKNGLPLKNYYTLADLGKVYGVTKERIRQLEAKGITKMTELAGIYKINIDENENYKQLVKKRKLELEKEIKETEE